MTDKKMQNEPINKGIILQFLIFKIQKHYEKDFD